MHICFVCREYPPSLRGGGIASYIKEVVHGLHAVGHQITVICASDNTCQESMYDDEGMCVIRLRGDRKSTRLNSSHANESRMPSSA